MTDDDPDEAGVAFVVPPLGESVTEAVVSDWLVAPGAFVVAEQPLAVVETDKMSIELTAPATGIVLPQAAPNDTVKIGDTIARITPPPANASSREQRHAELLAAVAATPTDLGARQVYADFLLEADGPIYPWSMETARLRGEYLNVVARLAQPHDGRDLEALRARRAELEQCGIDTARALVPNGNVVDGFVVHVFMTVADFEAGHAVLFARTPLQALTIRDFDSDTDIARLLAIPRLEQLRTLSLVGKSTQQPVPGNAVPTILGSPRFAGLAQVELHRQALEASAGGAIAIMPARSLRIGTCEVLPGFVTALGDRGFDRLSLDIYSWSPDDVTRMLARPLRALALSGSRLPDLPAVEVLELRGFKLDPAWRAPASVRSLSLSCTFPELSDLLALIANHPDLASLALAGAHIGKLPMNNSPVSRFADEIRAALGGITVTF